MQVDDQTEQGSTTTQSFLEIHLLGHLHRLYHCYHSAPVDLFFVAAQLHQTKQK